MKAGYAKMNISPKLGVELAGYGFYLNRASQGVLLDLYTRVLVIQENSATFAFVVCDLIGMTKAIVKKIETMFYELYGVQKENVFVVSTHCHTSPNVGELVGCGEPDAQYIDTLFKAIEQAGALAFSDLDDVCTVRADEFQMLKPIAYNRVYVDLDKIDHTARGILFERKNNVPIVIVNHSCHPNSYGAHPFVSGDYSGFLCMLLEEKGFAPLYLNGFCGDLNPREKFQVGCSERAGQVLFDSVMSSINDWHECKCNALTSCGGDLPINLIEFSTHDIEDTFRKQVGDGKNLNFYRVMSIWAFTQKNRIAMGEPFVDFLQFKAFRMGNIIIAMYSGEIAIELSRYIVEAFPEYTVLFVANAFSTSRYIASKELFELDRRFTDSSGHIALRSEPLDTILKSDREYYPSRNFQAPVQQNYETYSMAYAYNCLPMKEGEGEQYIQQGIRKITEIL